MHPFLGFISRITAAMLAVYLSLLLWADERKEATPSATSTEGATTGDETNVRK